MRATTDDATEIRNTVLFAGGAALIVFGTGLLMTNNTVRQSITSSLGRLLPDLQQPIARGLSGILPDVERYLRLRRM